MGPAVRWLGKGALAELRKSIIERPKDEAAWAVFGDWLAEHGDARGDYIALEQGRAKGRDTRALLEAHAAAELVFEPPPGDDYDEIWE